MTPLEQKLNQLSLSTMSRQLETTLTDAAAKNLSAAATLEWLADMEIEARSQRAIERRFRSSRLQAQPSIDAFHFHHHKSRLQAKNPPPAPARSLLPRQRNQHRAHRKSWRGQNIPGQARRLARLPG